MPTVVDAPPAPSRTGVDVCGVGGGDLRARAVRIVDGQLEVTLADGDVLLVDARALIGLRDGRAPIDAVLRPDASTVAITWRDGRRGRYDVTWLTGAALSLAA